MELTIKDRLMLANQYLILEKLYPNEAGHYANLRECLIMGYVLHYPDCIQGMNHEELSEDDCLEVRHILSMYEALKFGSKNFHDIIGIDQRHIKFMGFDGNEEAKLMNYTNHIIEERGTFKELKNDNPGFNSHCPMLEIYREILKEWRKSTQPFNLSAAEIERIVAVR
jgi:uncharacterized protein